MSASTSLHPLQQPAKAPATRLHAQPSPDFAHKLAQTQALLQSAARDFSPVKQASSLGAEDVVITDVINRLQLAIPVFVLDTGALHTETLALLERLQAFSHTPVEVLQPQRLAVLNFVRHPGQAAIYNSQAERQACCQIRKLEPLGRALAGLALHRHPRRGLQPAARPVFPEHWLRAVHPRHQPG